MKTCTFQPFINKSPFNVTISATQKEIKVFYATYYHQDFIKNLLPKVKAIRPIMSKKDVKKQKESFEILKRTGTINLDVRMFKDLLNIEVPDEHVTARIEIVYNKRYETIELLFTIRSKLIQKVADKINKSKMFTNNHEDKSFVKMGLLFFNFNYIVQ